MSVLAVDVGTTHCKAGVFDLQGAALRHVSIPTPGRLDATGRPYLDPEELWQHVAALIRAAVEGFTVELAGVTGMAEAGLLVDRRNGAARTEIIPWYDPRSTEQAERLSALEPAEAGYRRSGLYPSFKYGLPKIAWLAERDPSVLDGAVWLSVPDYIVHRLTGSYCTDQTLAARTYAYRIFDGRWDEEWIEQVGLEPGLFPRVLPSGEPAGVTTGCAQSAGLAHGIPVAVSGHDHVCTLLAVGVVRSGPILDSMGTAESLLGVMSRPPVDAFGSGLSIAPHVLPGLFCWLGGIPASGGSVEWLREQLGDEALPYWELQRLAREAGSEPTGIGYFPYLSGSGAPWHDQRVRAALVGLRADHRRGHLVRAVLEGTAYEARSILAAAHELTRDPVERVLTVGGGTHDPVWLQIKADVTGKEHVVPAVEEAALRGAALMAAVGAGRVSVEALSQPPVSSCFEPNVERHRQYDAYYRGEYLRLRPALHKQSASPAAPGAAHV